MAAAPKDNLGRFPCPCCGEPVALKRSATMKLSFVCDDADCEMSGYANPNTGAARRWLAKVVKRAVGADPLPLVGKIPVAAPKPAKTAPVAPEEGDAAPTIIPPAKTPPRSPFDLGALLGTKK